MVERGGRASSLGVLTMVARIYFPLTAMSMRACRFSEIGIFSKTWIPLVRVAFGVGSSFVQAS